MANLLLSGAALITLVLCWLSVAGRLPLDTDATGVTALFVFLTFPRWFAVAGVLRILLSKGEFHWVSSCRLRQDLIVYGAHALLGVAVLGANIAVHTGAAPEELRSLILFFTTLVPACELLYAAALVNPARFSLLPEDGMRKAACGAVAVGAIAGIALLLMGAASSAGKAPAKAAAVNTASDPTAELNSLPANAPVSSYLRFLSGRYPREVGAKARRRITMRPEYQQELTELLVTSEWSLPALEFVRTEILMPSPALAPAAAEAIRLLAEQIRTDLTHSGATIDEEHGFECRLALEIADRFPAHAHLFTEPIRQIQSAISVHERAASAGVRRELREWLDRHSRPVLEARNRRLRLNR